MNKLINGAKLCFAIGLILTTLDCGFISKSECELTETDGRNILGMNVVSIDKNDAAFGSSATVNKDFRACGYVSKEPTERGYLYWAQGKSADEQEAKRLFEMSGKISSDKTGFSVENAARLGDEAGLIRYEDSDSKHLDISVRKGKSIFLITVSKPSASGIPVEQVKSLAERIDGKTTDY